VAVALPHPEKGRQYNCYPNISHAGLNRGTNFGSTIRGADVDLLKNGIELFDPGGMLLFFMFID